MMLWSLAEWYLQRIESLWDWLELVNLEWSLRIIALNNQWYAWTHNGTGISDIHR